MAASGLTRVTSLPGARHVCAVADFVFAMKAQLVEVNRHSFNDFKLRVGTKVFELHHKQIHLRVPTYTVRTCS